MMEDWMNGWLDDGKMEENIGVTECRSIGVSEKKIVVIIHLIFSFLIFCSVLFCEILW